MRGRAHGAFGSPVPGVVDGPNRGGGRRRGPSGVPSLTLILTVSRPNRDAPSRLRAPRCSTTGRSTRWAWPRMSVLDAPGTVVGSPRRPSSARDALFVLAQLRPGCSSPPTRRRRAATWAPTCGARPTSATTCCPRAGSPAGRRTGTPASPPTSSTWWSRRCHRGPRRRAASAGPRCRSWPPRRRRLGGARSRRSAACAGDRRGGARRRARGRPALRRRLQAGDRRRRRGAAGGLLRRSAGWPACRSRPAAPGRGALCVPFNREPVDGSTPATSSAATWRHAGGRVHLLDQPRLLRALPRLPAARPADRPATAAGLRCSSRCTALCHLIPRSTPSPATAVASSCRCRDRRRLRWLPDALPVAGSLCRLLDAAVPLRHAYLNDMGWEKLAGNGRPAQRLPATSSLPDVDPAGRGARARSGCVVSVVLRRPGRLRSSPALCRCLAAASPSSPCPQARLWNARCCRSASCASACSPASASPSWAGRSAIAGRPTIPSGPCASGAAVTGPSACSPRRRSRRRCPSACCRSGPTARRTAATAGVRLDVSRRAHATSSGAGPRGTISGYERKAGLPRVPRASCRRWAGRRDRRLRAGDVGVRATGSTATARRWRRCCCRSGPTAASARWRACTSRRRPRRRTTSSTSRRCRRAPVAPQRDLPYTRLRHRPRRAAAPAAWACGTTWPSTTPEAVGGRRHPDLTEVAPSGPWHVYEVADARPRRSRSRTSRRS